MAAILPWVIIVATVLIGVVALATLVRLLINLVAQMRSLK